MKSPSGKKGFSLLELTLALSIGMIATFIKFQDMKNEQEQTLASTVGQQMKQIGEAVNGYINIRYNKLSTLENSAGNGTDPGPRTCMGLVCEITYQTLINEGLLPSSYTGKNIQQSTYKIFLRRDGNVPNYIINGLIATEKSWIEGATIRYDLLGKAMQVAGIDSGVTRTVSNTFGYGGQWTESSTNFNNITTPGQLTYRVGYNSALYSIYLRRDGTLPMTGSLNMGGQNIYNAKDITASGKGEFAGNITSGGTVTAAGEVIAHNGYGDTISLGGDAAGTDYEIRLGSAKPLSIFSPFLPVDERSTTTVFQTNGQMLVIGDHRVNNVLGTNGFDPRDLPPGWSGGVRTLDILASGTIAIAKDGRTGRSMTNGVIDAAASMDRTGNIYASNDILASGNIDGNNIKAKGSIESIGRVNVGEYLYLDKKANAGTICYPNGLQGRTSEGQILSCVNGLWKASSGTLENMVWSVNSGSNYGNVCQNYLNNNGLSSQGWIVTGSDACTEDGDTCSVDNVKCFAVRLK